MRLQGSTILIGSMGAATLIAVIMSRRREDEAPALPPWSPTMPPPEPDSIPSHVVKVLPASSTTATPLPPPTDPHAPEVEQMMRELTRPDTTPAPPKPTPIAPSGTADTEADRMARELTRPDTSAASRSPRQAATDLFNFVTQAIRDKQDAQLGSKASPSDFVAAAQRDMRLVASDGIYGDKTGARGKELLGREFPKRNPVKRRVSPTKIPAAVVNALPPSTAAILAMPPPEPPSLDQRVAAVSPREAAAALFELVTHPPVDWGTKSKPNPLIRGAQNDMGGLFADGIYGTKTQARGTILLGRQFPARK
jgi:hypothetical protein